MGVTSRLAPFPIVALLVLTSCNLVSPGNDHGALLTGQLSRITTTNRKEVYVSSISTTTKKQMVPRGINDTGTTGAIAFLNGFGKNEPITLTTTDGRTVILDVNKIDQMSRKYVAVYFDAIVEVTVSSDPSSGEVVVTEVGRTSLSDQKVLINLVDGNVYDFTGFNLEVALIDDDTVYVIRNDVVYKAVLTGMANIAPLYGYSTLPFKKLISLDRQKTRIVASQYEVVPFGDANDLLNIDWNAGKLYLLDTGGTTAPVAVNSDPATYFPGTSYLPPSDPASQGNPFRGSNIPSMRDANGDLWSYYIHYPTAYYPDIGIHNGHACLIRYKVDYDQEGNVQISDYSEAELPFYYSGVTRYEYTMPFLGTRRADRLKQYEDRLHVSQDGYVRVYLNPSGGLAYEAAPFQLPLAMPGFAVGDGGRTCFTGHVVRVCDFLYWLDGSTIMRFRVASSSAPEVYLSVPDIVAAVNVSLYYDNNTMGVGLPEYKNMPITGVGTSIFYYKNMPGGEVYTYRVDTADPSRTSVLVAPYMAKMRDVQLMD